MDSNRKEDESNYLAAYRTDNRTNEYFPIPIVFEDSNVERCRVIDYAPGWDGKGCLDPKHAAFMQSYFKVSGSGYTRVMYRCPKHGVVKDNLYFGSEEEKTGICKCYDCITDEIDRVCYLRAKREEDTKAEIKRKELAEKEARKKRS